MSDESQNQQDEPRDPLDEVKERLKQKLVMGKFVFDNVVAPKVKEVVGHVKKMAANRLNKVRDSLDPTRGLERNARDVRDWLKSKGANEKDANRTVETMVKNAMKQKPKKEKKDE